MLRRSLTYILKSVSWSLSANIMSFNSHLLTCCKSNRQETDFYQSLEKVKEIFSLSFFISKNS